MSSIATDKYKADIYYRETSYWAEIFLKGNWDKNLVKVNCLASKGEKFSYLIATRTR